MARKQRERSAPTSRARARRPRPTPRWLTGRTDLDQVAQRRCLMVLSVLSGEQPVTTAIETLKISRGTYYQLETKALVAMLAALAPGADGATTPDGASTMRRMAELESKVAKLEQDKRRLERLLYLARKLVPAGPVTTGPVRPARARKAPSSTSNGRRRLPSSRRTTTTAASATTSPAESLTPTPDGVTMR